MEHVEKFIDTQLVYSDYWFKEDTPRVLARKLIESIFYLHYVSNTYTGYRAQRAGLNLESLLRQTIRHYLDDHTSRLFVDILNGNVLYNKQHVRYIHRYVLEERTLHTRLVYGMILKVVVPTKPDISILEDRRFILTSITHMMAKSRIKKIICNPDSELTTDQYNVNKWLTREMKRIIYSHDHHYDIATTITLLTDAITLSFMQRTTKFGELFPIVKKLCVNDLLFYN